MIAECLVFAGTFCASFGFIFLKAWQQRNVAFDHYWWIVPTSLMMAVFEIYVISNIAQRGFGLSLILSVGLGSGFGALIAALAHKKFLGAK